MKTKTSLFVLGAAGVLSVLAGGAAVAQVDTSKWKCETCPFDKSGTSVVVEAGVGAVSDDSAKFGDYSGLHQKGAFAILGGSARYRTDGGVFGSVEASEIGLDTRAIGADVGREGLYRLRLTYSELPRHLVDGARSPFLGGGSGALTLPAGFPAGTTDAMPLAATLQPVDVGYKRSRVDAGVAWNVAPQWTTRVSLRHDVRDGTQRLSGSFFSTSAHLIAPVDQVTDQLEASVSYVARRLHATVGYQGSLFRNGTDSLTWANPFTPVVAGSTQGQLALAPDNEFHQLFANGGYEITPRIRASGDVAVGRMTQDAAFVSATLNPTLAVGTLPSASLQGKVDTFNGSARISAALTDRFNLSGTYMRDVRDNRTPSLAYPAVSTDMFVGAVSRSNQAFSFTQDRYKLQADLRGPFRIKASAGLEEDDRDRTLQEVVTTRETTAWGRVSAPLLNVLSLSLKAAHAERRSSTYGIASWVTPAENPLLRKFNLAERKRDSAGLRLDITASDEVSVGLFGEMARDKYDQSTIGLLSSRSAQVGGDISLAVSDYTQVNAFLQTERLRSAQAGSQLFGLADWAAEHRDHFDVLGIGLKHSALKGKLEISADLAFSRSRSDIRVDVPSAEPAFPGAKTGFDSLKVNAAWRYSEAVTLVGGYWYERYDAQDWRVDGVLPDTISNLLAFGEQPLGYSVHVLRLGVRYRF